MAFYLLQEDGFKIALEDGTGFILLEEGGHRPRPIAPIMAARRRRRRRCAWLFPLLWMLVA